MPPGGFLDGASLGRDCFLLCLSFFPGATINVTCQMRNPWPLRAYLSLIRFRVWIHLSNSSLRFAVAGIADPGPRAGTGISDTGKNGIRFLVKNEMPDRLILS
jgi:hypothetical protein